MFREYTRADNIFDKIYKPSKKNTLKYNIIIATDQIPQTWVRYYKSKRE